MSTLRRDLRIYLASKTALTALITGTNGRKHLHLSRIPQGNVSRDAYPAVVYRRSTGGHEHDLAGAAGYAVPEFEFVVIGEDPDVVEDICEQLRLALQGYRGLMGGTTIQRCTLDGESDDYIDSKIGDDVGFYMTSLQYTIAYIETVPAFS